jgi:trigger factor
VQAKVLPDADDDFAGEASEFATLEELRADIATRIHRVKASRAEMTLRENTAGALAELVDIDMPDALVASETQSHLQDLAMRASAQGLQLEQLLAMTGKDPAELSEELRTNAERSARIDLALRALAEAEGIVATDEQLDEEFTEAAQRMQRDPAEFRAEFERTGDLEAVRSDLRKRGALEWLLERVEIVDEDGNPLDRSDLEPPADSTTPADSTPDDTSTPAETGNDGDDSE